MRWPRVPALLSLVALLQLVLIWRGGEAPPPQCPPHPAPAPWSAVRRVGVLVVATGRYVRFVPQLLEDLAQHFLAGYNVTAVIFTDDPRPPGCTPQRCRIIKHTRYGWPYDTLLRWEGALRPARCS